jgi:hypothetical protein
LKPLRALLSFDVWTFRRFRRFILAPRSRRRCGSAQRRRFFIQAPAGEGAGSVLPLVGFSALPALPAGETAPSIARPRRSAVSTQAGSASQPRPIFPLLLSGPNPTGAGHQDHARSEWRHAGGHSKSRCVAGFPPRRPALGSTTGTLAPVVFQ